MVALASGLAVESRLPRNDIYLGWDVGGWNCDRNRKSRDGLCALTDAAEHPALLGTPWRGNVREILCTDHPLVSLLGLLGITSADAERIVVAIDTPLTWPSAAIALLTRGETVPVPREAPQNPYLFRPAEILLAHQGKQALSPVRDMIGSQSLKGVHFLSAEGLNRSRVGVWEREATPAVTAIECYPATCRQSLSVQRALSEVVLPTDHDDVRDAACAAAIAWLFSNQPEALAPPPSDFSADEGWIWIPADAFAPARVDL